MYLYISAGLLLFMCIAQVYMVIRRNGVFNYGGARAHITHEYGAVRVRIQLQKPLDVKARQAINLWMWMPSVTFWSFLQNHPFVVISSLRVATCCGSTGLVGSVDASIVQPKPLITRYSSIRRMNVRPIGPAVQEWNHRDVEASRGLAVLCHYGSESEMTAYDRF